MKRQQTIAGLLPLMTYKKTGSVIVYASSLFLIALDFFAKILDFFTGKTRKLCYVFYQHFHLLTIHNSLKDSYHVAFVHPKFVKGIKEKKIEKIHSNLSTGSSMTLFVTISFRWFHYTSCCLF